MDSYNKWKNSNLMMGWEVKGKFEVEGRFKVDRVYALADWYLAEIKKTL